MMQRAQEIQSTPILPEASHGKLFSRDGWLCVVLLGLAILATWPVAEIGINDDWSYIRTAQAFAQTHHFVYNGWATAMLGWQVLWGAAFAWLLGPSFVAIRLSMIPVALFTVLLFHAILRGFGLNRAHAVFGTLVLALSPLFLSLSDTLMSDIPGLFSILLCLYLCQRALGAEQDSHAALWIAAAGLTNILSGTARQIAWLGVLVMVPSCAWLMRRRRYIIPTTITTWLVGIVSIKLLISWFLHHPYSIPENMLPGSIHLHELIHILKELLRGSLSTALFMLPILVMAAAAVWPLRRPQLLRTVGVIAIWSALYILLELKDRSDIMRFPWLAGNIITPHGIMQDVPLFGSIRQASTGWQLLLLFIFLLCFIATLEAFRRYRSSVVAAPSLEQQLRHRETLILVVPLLTCYCLLLAPRAAFVVLFDRYLLVIIALLLIFLLRWHENNISPRVPVAAVAALAVVGLLSIAATHDLFAINRAEVRLLRELQQAGVPRTQIRGGFDFDSITQVDVVGYLNDPHLTNPPNSYHPHLGTPDQELPCGYPYLRYVPSLRIRYVISADPTPCLDPTGFPIQSYRTWLPPARRELFIGVPSAISPLRQP
jgi:hypothetical protein